MNFLRNDQEVAGQIVVYHARQVAPSSLNLANFKPFGARRQRLPIRPLTLIMGENSSGKSSVVQALLYAKNSFETNAIDPLETTPEAGGLDLGGFRQIVHRGDTRKTITIGFAFPTPPSPENCDTELLGGGGFRRPTIFNKHTPKLIGVELCFGEFKEPGFNRTLNPPNFGLIEYSIKADDALLVRFSGPGGGITSTKEETGRSTAFTESKFSENNYLGLDKIDLTHPIVAAFLEDEIREILGRGVAPHYKSSRFPRGAGGICVTSVGRSVIPGRRVREWDTNFSYDRLRFAPSLVLNPSVDEHGHPVYFPDPELIVLGRFVDEIIRVIHLQASDIMNRISYLGPFRLLANRDVGLPHRILPGWGATGGATWERLLDEPVLLQKVNNWLASPTLLASQYSLFVQDFVENSGLKQKPTRADRSRKQAALNQSMSEHPFRRLRLRDRRSNTVVTPKDVGVGISQVLPILVAAYGTNRHIHLMEQPEIHLHPRLQAELADVFIESALGEARNTFILETHSEHLLLRIMRRMRETASGKLPKGGLPITPSDVAILYVEREGKQSIVREMPLNENGELLKTWPGGFFEEGLREML